MQQYNQVKSKYPDAILLFRVGDFYETFSDDAVKAADVLGIILTNRNNGGAKVPLAGFPYHSLDVYLPKLVRAGFRVAICEQLEKASKEKKLVKRGVTDLVTPGVTTHDQILDQNSNNYLASIYIMDQNRIGISFMDISTGDFLVSEGNRASIQKLLQGFSPSEIIFAKSQEQDIKAMVGDEYYCYGLEDWIFAEDYTQEKLMHQFEVNSLKGFGIEALLYGQIAAGSILHYMDITENDQLKHINKIGRIPTDQYVWLDRFTIRNLELIKSNHPTGIPLSNILDKTVSPLGARQLKKWILLPLINKNLIEKRIVMVQHFYSQEEKIDQIDSQIRSIGDLERFISKAAIGKIGPREVKQIQRALEALIPIQEYLKQTGEEDLIILGDKIQLCTALKEKIEKEIVDDPPTLLAKGGVFKEGFNEPYDDYQNTIRNAKNLLLEIQEKEAAATGITNLKIGFNNVFGYYLEVTNKYKNKDLIPDNWVRKQTLTGSERYITDELKQLETKILSAQDMLGDIEQELYLKMVTAIQEYIGPIQIDAQVIATLDCVLSLAKVALKYNYVAPIIDESSVIEIKQGRHPVIERHLKTGEEYIPNDLYLDNEQQQIIMITGPNMSGKSAVLRQTALICLMGQMGSFVPASYARLGIIDKLFTRVGASDNISSGESTFMVEMNETASIMNNISNRSLILLDEIGRGTSTYDGISIAWSLAEYLHESEYRPKTLFATHYHELNELADKYDRIKNFNVSTKEIEQRVLFLRKLVAGGSKHSFGIHVAKMAGMPPKILKRAKALLQILEQKSIESKQDDHAATLKGIPAQEKELMVSVFDHTNPELESLGKKLQNTNVNEMTPIECMLLLQELKNMLKE